MLFRERAHRLTVYTLFEDTSNNRANGYNSLGQPQLAIEDCDEAIRLDPQLALAFTRRRSHLRYCSKRLIGELQRTRLICDHWSTAASACSVSFSVFA